MEQGPFAERQRSHTAIPMNFYDATIIVNMV